MRERLAGLAADPNAGGIHGSNGHRWRLEPPLRTAELAAVESQVRAELPGEYRSFCCRRVEAEQALAMACFRCVAWTDDGGGKATAPI